MKNIHVLPTKGTGTVYISKDVVPNLYSNWRGEGHHIYITSDEEIKEGDWYIYLGQINKRTRKNPKAEYSFPNYKKIILTTDQDLINNGIQAIPDEFLEWFVKNPSCEKVEVEKLPYDGTKSITKYWGGEYKIILPKEEPKQELNIDDVGISSTQIFTLKQEIDEVECNMCGNIMSLLEDESIYVCFNSECTRCYEEYKEEPKQETLEEAAEKYDENNTNDEYGKSYRAFIEGAKWQQQQMYSEEEVLKLILISGKLPFTSDEERIEWFEQFKKK